MSSLSQLLSAANSNRDGLVQLVKSDGFHAIDTTGDQEAARLLASTSQRAPAPGDCVEPNNFIALDAANGFMCTSRITIGGKGHSQIPIVPTNVRTFSSSRVYHARSCSGCLHRQPTGEPSDLQAVRWNN